ncbi:hypothetical protein R5W23_000638 [Gemmata sp. JC673]|uniref:HEAT repeat domain-containing protein n=1 Tax=Gemmata algarum TaxID=2975278 RepID=A0ABU5ES18_9BACT|nr:hypothetical protein [Gemmata algarum]MDY3557995.1 hypothetical protein [Gemmata algarum]
MRSIVPFAAALLLAGPGFSAQPAPDAATPAAELTRAKALKVKVSLEARDARLGDVLKEFAAQADARADMLILWAYGPGFPHAQRVTYRCKDKPIEDALAEVLKAAGGGLGYTVVSKDGDKRDGWVLLTAAAATAEDETAAADRVAQAKKLIDGGKPDPAKTLLTLVVQKYGATKAAAEARELLAKLGK